MTEFLWLCCLFLSSSRKSRTTENPRYTDSPDTLSQSATFLNSEKNPAYAAFTAYFR